jgi:hypothetical protein
MEGQFAGGRGSYFPPFPVRLRFDLAAASRRRLPILKRTALVAGIFKLSPVRRLRSRRARRSCTSKAAKADEVHCLALADGSFDPGEPATHDRLNHALRLPGIDRDALDQVSEKHNSLLLLSFHRGGSTTSRMTQQSVD